MVQTETRSLKMHPNLLLDVIRRQAGTLEKAMLEGAMNAVEADAPDVKFTLQEALSDPTNPDSHVHRLNISDDGKGISSRDEIIKFFETFGQPHTEDENVIWKQFRMGRGQLFAFGKNTWRTANFRMVVDIKRNGLDYVLECNLPFVQGCHIEIDLYNNPLKWTRLEDFQKSFTNLVRFFSTPVLFNGVQISTDPETCSWDYKDANAYYKFDYSSGILPMKVYNKGAFVMDISSSDKRTGMAGFTVSKKLLKVNFARNDVISDCPVFQNILVVFANNRKTERRADRRILNDSQRASALKDFQAGEEDYCNIASLKLIPTAQGKRVSLDDIRRSKLPWTFSPEGDRFADKMCEAGLALCLDPNILCDLGYSGEKKGFFTWLFTEFDSRVRKWRNECRYGSRWSTEKDQYNHPWKDLFDAMESRYTDFEKIKASKGASKELFDIIPDNKLRVTERRILKVLNGYNVWDGRIIRLGVSNTCDAWTDGKSYIVLNRDFVEHLYFGWYGSSHKLFAVLCHEMAHNNSTAGTHIHGPAFYENFYHLAMQDHSPMAEFADFHERLQRSRIDEKRQKESDKVEKAKKALDESLQNGTPKKGRGRPRKVLAVDLQPSFQ